jgi:hypothetical protein
MAVARTPAARPSRALALVVAGASALATLAMALAFVWPARERAAPRVSLGPVSEMRLGSVRSVEGIEDGPFRVIHIVRPAVGPPHALAGRPAPPRGQVGQFGPYGCSIRWRPGFVYRGETGWFRDPCHGQTFDLAGNCQSIACTRALDRVRLEVRADGEMVVYPDQIVRAPEQGWPPDGAAKP